jgi:cell shape-determining protein MreC
VRLQEQRALASRAERLQELLDLRTNTSLPTLAAEVIAGNPNPGLLTVTVNRGAADGVQPDMAVVSPKGVVGRVVGPVAAHASRVQLIIDNRLITVRPAVDFSSLEDVLIVLVPARSAVIESRETPDDRKTEKK